MCTCGHVVHTYRSIQAVIITRQIPLKQHVCRGVGGYSLSVTLVYMFNYNRYFFCFSFHFLTGSIAFTICLSLSVAFLLRPRAPIFCQVFQITTNHLAFGCPLRLLQYIHTSISDKKYFSVSPLESTISNGTAHSRIYTARSKNSYFKGNTYKKGSWFWFDDWQNEVGNNKNI